MVKLEKEEEFNEITFLDKSWVDSLNSQMPMDCWEGSKVSDRNILPLNSSRLSYPNKEGSEKYLEVNNFPVASPVKETKSKIPSFTL